MLAGRSSFTVDSDSLTDLAQRMGQFANRVGALGDLPEDDFGLWLGDPSVAEYTADFARTLDNEVKVYAMTIEILGSDLLDGAREYRRMEQDIANRAADH